MPYSYVFFIENIVLFSPSISESESALKVQRLDWLLNAHAVVGMGLSGLVFVLGAANLPILVGLWLLYGSLHSVGPVWYTVVVLYTCRTCECSVLS